MILPTTAWCGLLPLLAALFSSVSLSAGKADKCETCRKIATSFKEGVKNTAKSNFGGGNTAWEERKLNSYAFSETRLVEIVDKIAEDEKELAHMIEEHEELIEHWWFKEYAVKEDADLLQFLCIDNIKVCCPNGTFGSECSDCAGGRVRPCKDNGDCSGDGTRSGTGKCTCNAGYQGELCDECKEGYYEVEKNSTHTECKECHESCDKGCDEEGVKGCHECKKGWNMTEDDGCVDFDECAVEESPCKENEYCVNNEGSFSCLACDEACDKCTGGGPEKCVDCSDLFYKDGSICKACHESCKKSCSDDTPATCEECKDGWTHTETGCQDLNECEGDKPTCSSDEYCINSDGSYKCSTCHSACDGCTGAGTDNCHRCKPGYKLDDTNSCTDIDECDTQGVCAGEKQTCVNSPGSYKCNCDKGYKLKDGKCIKKETKKSKKKAKTTTSKKSSGGEDQQPARFSPEEDMRLDEGKVPPKFIHAGPTMEEMEEMRRRKEESSKDQKKIEDVDKQDPPEKREEL